ncbi:argininosuccinate synthase [Artemisia annua]|uniref:Argininosuccinate synthase n=1 Tax=Artemisia annua TaxID=35608 RepID=A0A2U1NLI1_ARTAN|nr:argininosuccinate synthase [Artemisia annua]
MVDIAREIGADAVAHGCTGNGNDQVRSELTFFALNLIFKSWFLGNGIYKEGKMLLNMPRNTMYPVLTCDLVTYSGFQILMSYDSDDPDSDSYLLDDNSGSLRGHCVECNGWASR